MRVLLIGAGGQLGTDIRHLWSQDEVVGVTHQDLDVTDTAAVQAAVEHHRPEVVVNTAAYHRVDECESQVARSFAVNAEGALNAARAAAGTGSAVVFISTDYVFDGQAGVPVTEDTPPNPLNVYGVSKLAGELLVRQANPRHLVVRSSGLYGVAGASGKGGNFVETMIRLAREGRPIKVVDDEALAQTSTADLAIALRALVASERYGLYHVANSGGQSWFRFAQMIFERLGLSPDLSPTTSREFGAAATRPPFSVLESGRLPVLGIRMRSVAEALEDYLVTKGYQVQAQPKG